MAASRPLRLNHQLESLKYNRSYSPYKREILNQLHEYLKNSSLLNTTLFSTTNPSRLATLEKILKHVNEFDPVFFYHVFTITRNITDTNSKLRDEIGVAAGVLSYQFCMAALIASVTGFLLLMMVKDQQPLVLLALVPFVYIAEKLDKQIKTMAGSQTLTGMFLTATTNFVLDSNLLSTTEKITYRAYSFLDNFKTLMPALQSQLLMFSQPKPQTPRQISYRGDKRLTTFSS